MRLPIRCMASGCGHRFARTAAEVLANDLCPKCGSNDIDADDGDFESEAPRCSACGGPGEMLGHLGNVTWWRCRDCGLDFQGRAASKVASFQAVPRAEWERRSENRLAPLIESPSEPAIPVGSNVWVYGDGGHAGTVLYGPYVSAIETMFGGGGQTRGVYDVEWGGMVHSVAAAIVTPMSEFERAWHVYDGDRIVAGGPGISRQRAEEMAASPDELAGGPYRNLTVKQGALVREPAAIAMDPASEVNQETARCAFCLKTYSYRSADPTEPVPACPHCGSTATTPAGAAGAHTAADTGCNTCGHPWSEHTYGFTSNASGRCDGCHACDREKGGGHTALLLRTAAKIEEIALSVKASNPGMSDSQAVSIANETVRRYPKVVSRVR